MTHANLSEAVRQVVAGAGEDEDIHEVVDRARSAMVDAEGISLFGLETPHPDFGTMHWLVGQPGDGDGEYLVLAIGARSEPHEALPLFSAASDDLGEAFRQLISDCWAPHTAEELALA